jgi:hypothetical protein
VEHDLAIDQIAKYVLRPYGASHIDNRASYYSGWGHAVSQRPRPIMTPNAWLVVDEHHASSRCYRSCDRITAALLPVRSCGGFAFLATPNAACLMAFATTLVGASALCPRGDPQQTWLVSRTSVLGPFPGEAWAYVLFLRFIRNLF